jgi:uncharacterized protein YutE (UPF0331/DUF86 family)
MDNLIKKVEAEESNVEITLKNLTLALSRIEKTIIELAAIATFIHNFYNGIENILKQILNSENIELKKSSSSHKDLIILSVSKGIISQDVGDILFNYLSFRHFFVHAYGFMIDEAKLEILTKDISSIWSRFLGEIKNYIKK